MVLYSLNDQNEKNELIGRTEVVSDDSNPQFVWNITVDFLFEEIQLFRFEIYDCDDFDKVGNPFTDDNDEHLDLTA